MLLFWLHPVMFSLLALIVIALLLVSPIKLISTPVTLPDFAGTEQEDFWSLQKKLVDHEPSATASVKLTHAEFNAFLSRYQTPPEGGFCLQRLRCVVDNNRITLFVTGSGFFMRSLVFQIELKKTAEQIRVECVKINSLNLAGNNWFAAYVIDYLKKQAVKNAESSVARIISGKGKVEFMPDHVLLQGEFMPTQEKPASEELPVVENEETSAEIER
ncbi:MAG: hypothetical protein CVV42_08075 [Candidatus Riflebacteria bacterium HGW-Riflebacteria-2]|nr:MAG: hypothetical protein CVV42_08075 [Candidatus Riflebacteria bacterium HGW-Riflebacteria-2]